LLISLRRVQYHPLSNRPLKDLLASIRSYLSNSAFDAFFLPGNDINDWVSGTDERFELRVVGIRFHTAL